MSTPAFPIPPQIAGFQRTASILAGVGFAVVGLGFAVSGLDAVLRALLYGFLFCMAFPLGCMALAMIHHLSGGWWGLIIRRILEASTRTLPVMAVIGIVLMGVSMGRIYPWNTPEAAADPLLKLKIELFLNPVFFMARTILYFAAWLFLGYNLNKWSLEMDTAPTQAHRDKLAALSGAGLVILATTVTFSAFDWAMSLDPHWGSTIFGVLFMVGDVLSSLSLCILVLQWLGKDEPLAGVVRPTQVHDIGKLTLAFTMLWAYIQLSQFLIIWSGNLPEEIPWYLRRMSGGWQYLSLALIFLHFVLPFLLLLSRRRKRSTVTLARVARLILAMRTLDLFFLIGPETRGGGHGDPLHVPFGLPWLEIGALLGLGGLWLMLFARELRTRSLVPVGDPDFRELAEDAHTAEAHP